MTLLEIKAAVISALRDKYKTAYKIYGNDTTEGYVKPCLFVYIEQTYSDRTKNAFHRTAEIEINCVRQTIKEAESMAFFADMEELFGSKLMLPKFGGEARFLNCSDLSQSFTGENNTIPVFTFTVEYWDQIIETTDADNIGSLSVRTEIHTP